MITKTGLTKNLKVEAKNVFNEGVWINYMTELKIFFNKEIGGFSKS
ncbi:hypothetical protein LPC_0596 [Legionella pneumophila str. Corby]|nr:hypothetical protein LPC_0596 [Legionella pneumophila str. Corby]ADG24511.1 hypothetical protein lpa_01769 [Legionella pneumophila 2300/99 Alcoy]